MYAAFKDRKMIGRPGRNIVTLSIICITSRAALIAGGAYIAALCDVCDQGAGFWQ